MATMTFGQLDSWDSEGGGKRTSKEDYLNIKTDGKYNLRFLTEPPFKFAAHWVEVKGGRKLKINCAGRDCVLCKGGNEPMTFFVSIVLNRDLGRCQVFEFKRQVFDGLKLLFNNKKWGSLLEYDVEVDRKLSRKPEVYKTTPQPKDPLSKEDLAMIAEFKERISLDKHCAPMDNEAIEKRIAEASGETFTPRSITPDVAAAATSVDEDPDFSFT